MISIIISTRNRLNKLKKCLLSLHQNTFRLFEIVIIDQSTKPTSIFDITNNPKIVYLHDDDKGKSKALNKGIKIAKGDILAFTDDDCVVTSNWLQEITYSFRNPKISGIFGKTLPYQPELHLHEQCPSTFSPAGGQKIITKPVFHAQAIGFGNNMAFRKSVLIKLEGFRWWLGPGSIGSNAEDADIALRALINNKTLLYNPKMVLYHNRWLTPKEATTQYRSYICGESACYGLFALSGYQFADNITRKTIVAMKSDFRKSLINLANGKPKESWGNFLNGAYRLKGLAVAAVMSQAIKIGLIK